MFERLGRFITPDRSSPWLVRALPYITLVLIGLSMFIVAGAGWEYTNSTEFCGTQCHTMPPQYVSFLKSPHSNVKCVECHIGRATIATQFGRKAQDISHVIEFIGADYHTPIYTKKLRPASQVCEKCHNPEKFSPDKLRTFDRYSVENNNQLETVLLSFKIGGGTEREGRGKGIHWHNENPVEYIFTDSANLQQEIPWVRVTDPETGETQTFVDGEANLPADFAEANAANLRTMDCVTCHNRESHEFPNPSDALDDAMSRGQISAAIPYIKQNAVAVMERQYPSMDYALTAIRGLSNYYETNWPDYYAENQETVDAAVAHLEAMYQESVFPSMDVSWESHPDNLGHRNSPGCFRCHDGKHVNENNETIRVECNLCHSLPMKAPQDGSTPYMPVSEPFEPESHIDSNWIARHRYEFDNTCQGCHDVSDPGGSSDTSFCSNSSCHATDWKYAGLDATHIVEISNQLVDSLPRHPEAALTWNDLVGPILQARCTSCHGGTAGLELETFEGAMAGGNLGPAIVPGDAEASLLVQLQREGHPNSLPAEELEWIIEWINSGAPQSSS